MLATQGMLAHGFSHVLCWCTPYTSKARDIDAVGTLKTPPIHIPKAIGLTFKIASMMDHGEGRKRRLIVATLALFFNKNTTVQQAKDGRRT